MPSYKRLIMSVALATLWSAAALGAPQFSIGGYGTVGLVTTNQADADFVRSISQPKGVGLTERTSARVDTRIGVQADARLSDHWSAVVQVLSQYDAAGNYRPSIEWANVKYEFSPAFSLRLGRKVTSYFLASDRKLVGYTYTWARPPSEIYDLMPVTSIDGIDAIYDFDSGSLAGSLVVSFGQRDVDAYGGTASARNIFDIHSTLDIGNTTIHVGYTTLDFDYHDNSQDALIDGIFSLANAVDSLPGMSATGSAIRKTGERYNIIDRNLGVASIGVRYEKDQLTLSAEAGRFHISQLDPRFAWGLYGSYRVGRLTPYLVLSKVKSQGITTQTIQTSGLPGSLATSADALNDGIETLVGTLDADQHTLAAGIRLDMIRSVAIKAQFDRIHIDNLASSGHFVNATPQFDPRKTVNVFSLVADFVF